MEFSSEKIENAVLAVLYLTLHDGDRAWKTLDWDTLYRLHQAGYLLDPINKAKSVTFTQEGLDRARQISEQLFAEDSASTDAQGAGPEAS